MEKYYSQRHHHRSILLVCAFIVCCIDLQAQYARPSVQLKARPTNHSIKLRWAPSSPALWKLANKYGYTIERTKMMYAGKFTEQETKILTVTPIKPAAPDLWQYEVRTNDYVAVAAQAIYGETFELTQNKNSKVMNVVSAAKELESRHSFAVYSADQSIRAAALSGLYFEDETVEPKAKYLYRVFANVPREILPADTGAAYIGVSDFHELPRISDVQVSSDSRVTTISWNGSLVSKDYNAFWVERSSDSLKFERVNKNPLVNTSIDGSKQSRNVFYNDSVKVTNERVYYRIIGINAFGETGPPTEAQSVVPLPLFLQRPSILKHSIDTSGVVTLEWAFSAAAESQLHQFSLQRLELKTKRLSIVKDSIPITARIFIDRMPHATNYYVVVAQDQHGRKNASFPYLVQLEDSIPPLAPVDVKGGIDSAGVVTISWKPNREIDLHGYIVYRANFLSEEFLQVSKTISERPTFVDSISLMNLTETIHYRIVALDKRFNHSDFSAVLTLKKPDKIPPLAPVLKQIRNDSLGIYLEWAESASEDVRSHLLYRRREDETDWTLIHLNDDQKQTPSFLDSDVSHGKYYEYTIIALDDDQLESATSNVLHLKRVSDTRRPPIGLIDHKINADNSILLRWSYDEPDTQSFRIYIKDGKSFQLFQEVKENQCVFNVHDKRMHRMEFFLVARFKTGEVSEASKVVVIER